MTRQKISKESLSWKYVGEVNDLVAEAEKYDDDGFSEFCTDVGYQPWMQELLDAETEGTIAGEDLTYMGCVILDDFMRSVVWETVHPNTERN